MHKYIVVCAVILLVYVGSFCAYMYSSLVFLGRYDVGYIFMKDDTRLRSAIVTVYYPIIFVFEHVKNVRFVTTSQVEE